MDDFHISETSYLNVPDRDKNQSPAESVNSSISDLSTLPISSGRRRDYGGLTRRLVFAIGAAAIGSAFQHGYNTGVVNAPQVIVSQFINETYHERFGNYPLESRIKLIYSIIVSLFCIGGMIGALMTGFVADRFGRKGGLLLNNLLVFVAAIFLGFSKAARSYEMLIFGRFICGLNSGLNAGLAPMYLAEISPNHLRGAIGTIYQLVITIAIFISNLIGLPSGLGTVDGWPWLFALIIFPAIFMYLTLPFCPESPKYILIIQGRDVNAQKALTWLRGTIEIHDELDDLRGEYEKMRLVTKVTLSEMWYNPSLRQPLIIAVMVMLSQQFSGINAAISFSTDIFKSAGLTDDAALYSTMGMSIINVAMTFVSLVLVERAGRRTLLLFGLGGMCVTTIILAFCLGLHASLPFLSYISIIAVFVFIIMFATGPGSIPWFLVAELFGAGAKGLATSVSVATNWAANFIVSLAFLPLKEIMEGYVFFIFTILLVGFWLFTYKKVPETKGKSTDEISALFRTKAYQLS